MVVQQIMAEFNGAMLEEAKTVAITKIIFHGAKWPLEFISVICCTEPGLTKALHTVYCTYCCILPWQRDN
jgi:hypothetical protein